ncbi:MAG TPA: acetolactate decarboxylase [Acidimicrobiia bacterium]|nr:acetolactate decarboxylase [Acidimicrobiia bacterium]
MTAPGPERRSVFQTSLVAALLDGVYDGDMRIGDLLGRGDVGLGTFNGLDGEMIVLDSVCYRLRADGTATQVGPDERTPFAIVTSFVPDIVAEVPAEATPADLAELVVTLTGTDNYLYAARITGSFSEMSVRNVVRQERPYRPLAEVTRGEPVVRMAPVEGVMVGFQTPAFERGIGVPGGHLHFIDASRSRGGHVLDFAVVEATVELCLGTDLHLALPLTADFRNADLAPPDLDAQVEATERHR